jgi:hypothetical protein
MVMSLKKGGAFELDSIMARKPGTCLDMEGQLRLSKRAQKKVLPYVLRVSRQQWEEMREDETR